MSYSKNLIFSIVLINSIIFIFRCSDNTTTSSEQDGSTPLDVSIQKCTNSAQCKSGYECDPVKKVCVESRPDGGAVCKNNLDCVEPGTECINGKCTKVVDAITDVISDSGDIGDISDASYYCNEDKDCNDPNKICDPNSHSCVDKNRPIIFVDPQVINFGAVFYGQCATRTFKIQNIGSADLRITMIDFESGTNPEPPANPRFTLTVPIAIPGTISSNSSIDIDIKYCQDDATPDKGNILIVSNDESKPQYKLPIVSSYKDSPDFAVVDEKDFNKKLWPPTANPYQYTIDMGNASSGSEIKKRIYFTNFSTEAILEISKLYITKTTSSNNEFEIKIYNNLDEQNTVNTPIYDNPSEVYFVEVTFKCNEDKFDEASVITFQTNDTDIDNDTVMDDGSTTVLVKAQCNYQGPKITLDRQRIEFGSVQVNDEKSEQLVAKNDGKVNLVITEAKIDNPGNSLTLLVNNQPVQPPINVTPGGSITFTVKYAPKQIETVSTSLLIKSNDSIGNDNLSIPVIAAAIDPTISVDNQSLDFGTILYDPLQGCSSDTKTLTISNAGFGQLVISSIGLTAGSSTDFVLSNIPAFPIILDSAQKISINITFIPSVGSQQNGSPTPRTGAISIENSDRKSNFEVVVSLSGEGKTCCPPRPNATGVCTCSVGCQYTCEQDYYDLNGDLNSPGQSDGCEYNCVKTADPKEICDGKDNDCNGQTDEGSIDILCPAPQNSITVCDQGECKIISCAGGFYDVDGVYSTGCECQADSNDLQGVGNTCEGALAIQSEFVDSAQNFVDITGKIIPLDDEDWYRVVARDDVNADRSNGGDNFHFAVYFLNNPNNAYLLEIRENDCNNANVKCINDTVFEWKTDFRQDVVPGGQYEGENPCTTSCISNNFTTNCCNDNSRIYLIKVYRNSNAPYNCDTYTMRISNGLPLP